jgi:hypothetical protein
MYDETVKRRIGISDEERTGISDEEMDESVETENGGRAVTSLSIWYGFIHPLAPRNLRLGGCERSKVALPTFYGFVIISLKYPSTGSKVLLKMDVPYSSSTFRVGF